MTINLCFSQKGEVRPFQFFFFLPSEDIKLSFGIRSVLITDPVQRALAGILYESYSLSQIPLFLAIMSNSLQVFPLPSITSTSLTSPLPFLHIAPFFSLTLFFQIPTLSLPSSPPPHPPPSPNTDLRLSWTLSTGEVFTCFLQAKLFTQLHSVLFFFSNPPLFSLEGRHH